MFNLNDTKHEAGIVLFGDSTVGVFNWGQFDDGYISARQIASGFRAIAQTIAGNRGTPGKRRGAMTYLGWTLKGLLEGPPD